MQQAAILEAFAGLSDPRRGAGQRHTQPLIKAAQSSPTALSSRHETGLGDQGKP